MFSDHELEDLKKHVSGYPDSRAGAIYCLYAVQDKASYINDEGINIVIELTGLSKVQLEELISFYTLLRRRPVGRNVIRICDSITCHVMGSTQIIKKAIEHTGVPLGEISKDGSVTVLPNICLGLCDHAPAALLNDRDEVSKLTPQKIAKILDEMRECNKSFTGSEIIVSSNSKQNSIGES